MKIEIKIFLYLVPFFAIMSIIYGVTTALYGPDGQWEPVGTLAILLTGGLMAMIGVYLTLVSRRIDPRPEDDDEAVLEDGDEYGKFAPWSWWPIALAVPISIFTLGLAIGWWICFAAAALTLIAVAGWVLEFNRGIHSH